MHLLVVICVIIVVHLSALALTTSSFVPDEYWQSLEVAHNIVYHYGYLTWEWQEGLRSYVYPSVIALLYYILKFCQLDSVNNLVFVPRLLQTCLSATSDIFFVCWVARESPGAGPIALFSICTCWCWLYCASRTLVNTLETSLTAIALFYFPWTWSKKRCSSLPFLSIVGFASVVRPTAVIPWVPLCLYNIASSPKKMNTFVEYMTVGLFSVALLMLVDGYFYNSIIITPINFFNVNVLKNISDFYGTHSLSWYLLNGLPSILGLHIVPFLLGCIQCFRYGNKYSKINSLLCNTIIFTISTYSVLPHKEFRFILPVVPMTLFISSFWLWKFLKELNRYVISFICNIYIVASVVPLVYLGVFHQRGTLDVMADLAYDASANPNETSILFLMPCHSTPLYSHLHVNVTTRFLTCDPRDLFYSNLPRDEADEFFLSPATWLDKNLKYSPSHIVLFDVLYPAISEYFIEKSYSVFSCYHHAHFTEGRVGNSVYILKRKC